MYLLALPFLKRKCSLKISKTAKLLPRRQIWFSNSLSLKTLCWIIRASRGSSSWIRIPWDGGSIASEGRGDMGLSSFAHILPLSIRKYFCDIDHSKDMLSGPPSSGVERVTSTSPFQVFWNDEVSRSNRLEGNCFCGVTHGHCINTFYFPLMGTQQNTSLLGWY